MKNLVIFASGSGTNAENIIRHFKLNGKAVVKAVFCNRPDADVIVRAKKLNTEVVVFNKKDFQESDKVIRLLEQMNADLIVLAGFLWLIPDAMIKKYPHQIINIHPALLPKHGGKGFYGANVHRAVLETGDRKSGITIHYVNENFDEGEIIFQKECEINVGETPETLAHKVRALELEYYPKVIEEILNN